MMEYPYFSPIVMTDDIFILYGGNIGTSTVEQRQAAYLLAEEQMTEHLGAFLTQTIVTGTYTWNGGNPFELDYGYVKKIHGVIISDYNWSNSCQLLNMSGCAVIRDWKAGYIDLSYTISCGGCGSIIGYPPYNVQVVYESGLASGTVTQSAMLAALTIAAQINLNEWDATLTNEGVADIGVQSFSNQSYSEQRVMLGRNAFGSSALSQRAAKLVKKYRSRSGLSFHR